jgi:hypothetical protein
MNKNPVCLYCRGGTLQWLPLRPVPIKVQSNEPTQTRGACCSQPCHKMYIELVINSSVNTPPSTSDLFVLRPKIVHSVIDPKQLCNSISSIVMEYHSFSCSNSLSGNWHVIVSNRSSYPTLPAIFVPKHQFPHCLECHPMEKGGCHKPLPITIPNFASSHLKKNISFRLGAIERCNDLSNSLNINIFCLSGHFVCVFWL